MEPRDTMASLMLAHATAISATGVQDEASVRHILSLYGEGVVALFRAHQEAKSGGYAARHHVADVLSMNRDRAWSLPNQSAPAVSGI